MAHLHGKSKEGRKQTNQQLGFNSLHSLTLGNFLFPQFLKYRLLFQITLLQHLSLVVFHPGNHRKHQSASLLIHVVHPKVVCWLLCYRCWNSAEVGFLLQFSSSLSNDVCCPCLSRSSYPTETRIKERKIPSDGLKVMTSPWLLLDQLWRKGLVTSCRLEW